MSLGVTFIKIYPSDWRSGTVNILDLMEEGLYCRCCMYSYDTGEAVPIDDMRAARILGLNHNQYRAVMARLLAKGKMMKTNSGIINSRVRDELAKWWDQKEVRSQAAKQREEQKKQRRNPVLDMLPDATAQQGTPPVHPQEDPPSAPPQCAPKSPPVVTPPVFSEKSNKINDKKAEVCHGTTTNPETRNQKPEKERERELGDQREDAPPPDDALPPVRFNCTAVVAPEFAIPYSAIDAAAESTGLDQERARKIALGVAEEWFANGKVPDSPSAMLIPAFKAHASAATQTSPTLFGPEPIEPKKPKAKRQAKDHGTELPIGFVLPDDWREWAKKDRGLNDMQINFEAQKFTRWWTSPDAKNRLKKDWKRTWQNWIDGNLSRGTVFNAPANSAGGSRARAI